MKEKGSDWAAMNLCDVVDRLSDVFSLGAKCDSEQEENVKNRLTTLNTTPNKIMNQLTPCAFFHSN